MRFLLRKDVWLVMLPWVVMACSSGPDLKQSTRTGTIADIKIGEQLSPQRLEVRRGDEIRWINSRSAPIDIVFVDSLKDRISCQNGFVTGGLTGMFSEDATKASVTTIEPDNYASLCFASPGTYTYNARMKAVVPGSEKNLTGTVSVR